MKFPSLILTLATALAGTIVTAALSCISALPMATSAVAQELIELQPDYVYGRNRKPRLGYRKPEVFDPLSDRLYQSGYRDYPPTAIPEELKQVDALTRVQKMGRVMACADGWFWPFSRTTRKHEPPGIEIEILRAIAKRHDWEVDVSWANTGTRFGQGLAFAKTIDRGICDIFLGVTVTGDDHHMENHGLTFTRPFLSSGFVLVVQGAAKDVKTLDDIKARGIKIGVPAYSPIHEYVRANGFENEGFFQNYQVIDALVTGKIDAAMIWSGAISQARLEHPEAEFVMVKGYQPVPEMRWNSAWAIKAKEVELKQFLDEAFEQMVKSGEVRRIVERYGMPYMPPF